MDKQNLIGLLPANFSESIEGPAFRIQQIFDWIYRKKVDSFSSMTNLPLVLREKLASQFKIGSTKVLKIQQSATGARKYLIGLSDGQAVEAVLIPYKNWVTLCLSTQVGCPGGCVFCFSGRNGLKRNLSFQEIVEEIWLIEKIEDKRVKNIVFMGMGEPLLNYPNLARALEVINSPQGLGIGSRRITVSTVGIPDKIVQLARDWPEVNLAISLHAPDDKLRNQLVPLNRTFPLKDVLAAWEEYFSLTHKRVTVEYGLWRGVNDKLEHVYQLCDLVANRSVHINLIPGNGASDDRWRPSSPARVKLFAQILRERGINTTIRRSLGHDIKAACGELSRTYIGKEEVG
ncbi:MAG: rRNA (adenine2503-C2)-methyltransferase [Candidatus Atribacteria bacterium]|nr:rRNA (adenine2503-C2)-methyltransferase [Candidatus Atribacteria bacterium]